jgi:N-acetylmuramoyl-L-alanine amidase
MRVLCGLMLAVSSLVAGAAELRDVRVWASPDGTRVVFDLDGVVEHKRFTLENPARIVVDLPNTRRAAGLGALLEGKGVIQRVRSSPHDATTLRVVLDLAANARSKSFALQPNESYGFRVVVDVATDAQAAQAVASTVSAAPAAPVAPISPKTILAEKPIVIAVDAGHGGEDPGARGRRGLLEKDVSLALARRLSTLVNREPGLRSVMIRDGDYYVPLKERIAKARHANADLFISIHANSYKDPKVRGTAVYVLSPKGAKSEHAMMLEHRENMSDLIGGADIEEKDDTTAAVLVDIFQTSAMEASHDAGGRLLDSMGRVNVLQRPRVQQAAFVVLKSATFPSVLVETAFLTNDREERLLADPTYQEALARSMLDGIKGYFKAYRPMQQVAERPAAAVPVSMGGAVAR